MNSLVLQFYTLLLCIITLYNSLLSLTPITFKPIIILFPHYITNHYLPHSLSLKGILYQESHYEEYFLSVVGGA